MAWVAGSGWPTYTTTLMASLVTPGDVAPPLSPEKAGRQGGANSDGIFTRPVAVSQSGPGGAPFTLASAPPGFNCFGATAADALPLDPVAVDPFPVLVAVAAVVSVVP